MRDENVAVLVGTITRLVTESCKEQAGEHFLGSLTIHPVLRKAYETITQSDTKEDVDKHGTVWFTQHKPITLQPGQVFRVTSIPKFPGDFPDQLALIDQPTNTMKSCG